MTLAIGVMAANFCVVMADKRVSYGNELTLPLPGGQTFTVKSDQGFFADTMTKLTVSSNGENIVAIAGTVRGHQAHLAGGKDLDGFALDEHIAGELGKLNKYAEWPTVPVGQEFPIEHVLHFFRSGDRFVGTQIISGINQYTRMTVRSTKQQLMPMVIGSGAQCWTPSIAVPPVAMEWLQLSAKSETVTPQEIVTFLSRVFKSAAVFFKDVGPTYDAWLLEREGPWKEFK
jgi:hypothetical protein